jgi:hypothetical protein
MKNNNDLSENKKAKYSNDATHQMIPPPRMLYLNGNYGDWEYLQCEFFCQTEISNLGNKQYYKNYTINQHDIVYF